jgi:hypothetical protein
VAYELSQEQGIGLNMTLHYSMKVNFFSAPELMDITTATYMVGIGVEDVVKTHKRYSGCLVFRLSDLANTVVERSNDAPVLVTV